MNHAQAGFDILKCDVTTILDSYDGTEVILLLNFNLPKYTVVQEVDSHQDALDTPSPLLPTCLQQVQDFLQRHFSSFIGGDTSDSSDPHNTIYYHMSASYWLQHRHTLDRRRWVGSFFPKESARASLTGGSIYSQFDPSTFVSTGLATLKPQSIRQSLTVNFFDSNWQFQTLISAIVTCQLRLPAKHAFIKDYELLHQTHQRRKRRHITLFPFSTVEPSQATAKETVPSTIAL